MKGKIVWRLAACFGAVLLLFAAVLGGVFTVLFREHTVALNRASMEARAVSVADTLAQLPLQEAGEPYGGDPGQTVLPSQGMGGGKGYGGGSGGGNGLGYGSYLRYLDQLAMAEIWVVDQDLHLLTYGHGQAPSDSSQLPQNAEEIVHRVFEGEVTYGEEFSGLLETPSLTVGAPIRRGETVVGAVLLHSPVSGVEEAVRQGLSLLGAAVAAALVLAGGAAVALSCRFTRPLRQMEQTALQLSEGRYDVRTGVRQEDEIGRLACTLDQLGQRLDEAERQRAELDRMREDFVASVSHELRTPVAVLRGSLELLRDGAVEDPGERTEYYDQMLRESRHLERLVNDLLDLTRLQDAQFRLEMAPLDLRETVRDGVRSLRPAAEPREVSLAAELPEEPCVITGDYGRVRQLLVILLDNAVKFSDPGGQVETAVKVDSDKVVLTVTDHGVGIPPEELPRIFDRFRKSRSRRNRTGTGLGLAIAREIAQRHGAEIRAESGGGTTRFTVAFPAAAENSAE